MVGMADEFDVIGFGAINLDKIYMVDKIPGKDEEGFVLSVEFHPGGSAANTIVGLSRLGLKASYIGKVGSDSDGDFLLKDFINEGVDTKTIIRAEGRSGTAMIFVDRDGNRAILVDPGVNDTIRYEEIDVDYVSRFRLMHLTSFICKNGEDSFISQKKLVNELDIQVSFDPGMIYVERGMGDLKDILKNTTVFLPNRREIELLTGMDYITSAHELVTMGVDVVVIKLGEEGCYIFDGKKEYTVPAYSVEAVDSTGAGDAFNAGFLYGYLKGKSLEECGKLGNLVAAMNIKKVGARAGLPKEDELKEFGEV